MCVCVCARVRVELPAVLCRSQAELPPTVSKGMSKIITLRIHSESESITGFNA
jgi:hypothetical protein